MKLGTYYRLDGSRWTPKECLVMSALRLSYNEHRKPDLRTILYICEHYLYSYELREYDRKKKEWTGWNSIH